ncbi:MAG: linear amide C-N hydrolase [Anaerolineaceae bacterium]|nr:linear amide C-N hydrolase [Anaerolineaceae bacterium]
MYKKWIVVAGVLLVFLLLIAAFPQRLAQLRTLASLKKVDNHPLFVMRYYGDYGFDRFLLEGIRAEELSHRGEQPLLENWACTCFAALDEAGERIFGRNFDWQMNPALLLFSDPPGAYASVSMVDLHYLGYDISGPSWFDRKALLDAPYLPFDGMNEYGLAVGMMALPRADANTNPGKRTIDSLHAIRLLLDYAKNVDEGITLLANYNIDFGNGPPLHYLISDVQGHSAVIEYVRGEMRVIRNDELWQVSTNFVISETENPVCERYLHVGEVLETAEGQITQADAMELLEDVSQPNTRWSVIYNMASGEVMVAMGRKYDRVYLDELMVWWNQK